MLISQGISNLSIGPNKKDVSPWLARPSEKCSGAFYVESTKLYVNWFKLSQEIAGKEIFEYSVTMNKIIRRGPKETRKAVSHLHAAVMFWAFLRQKRIQAEDFVFDDYDTLWSLENYAGDHFKMQYEENGKAELYECLIKPRMKFALKFSRENPSDDEQVNRSCKFLKCLFTQKFRYSPDRRDLETLNFTKKFIYDRNAIFHIPQYNLDPKVVIAPNIEAWFGIYMAIRETYNDDPVINFGLVDRLFYNYEVPQMSFIEYFLTIAMEGGTRNTDRENMLIKLKEGNYGMSESQKTKAAKLLADLKLKCSLVWDIKRSIFIEKHVTFIGFSKKTADSFIITGRRNVSYVELYAGHGQPITYRKLPLIECKSGKSTIELPMETLFIHEKPQRFKNTLDFNMRTQFVRAATREPHVHKKLTEDMLSEFQFDSHYLNFLGKFDISPNLKMIECPGKVLNPANLVNGENQKIKLGETIRGFMEKRLNIVPQGELCVAVIVLRKDDEKSSLVSMESVKQFYKDLMDVCIERGIRVGEENSEGFRSLFRVYENIPCYNGPNCFRSATNHALELFKNSEGSKDKNLFFLVISHRSFDVYGHIKYVCDVELGVANQVVNIDTLNKANNAVTEENTKRIFYNLALKINAKLDGVNQEIEFSEGIQTEEEREFRKKEPLVMYVGIDVTHPTHGSGIDFSIASILASMNPGATRYRNEIIAQMEKNPNRIKEEKQKPFRSVERTDILENKFVLLLQMFAERNQDRIPDRIVVFRDGVSDSELLATAYDELKSLKNEVNKFLASRSASHPDEKVPQYTYIVIQKRHSTRFYRQTEDAKEIEKSGNTGIVNVKSGTVVDKVVVSRYKFDFFLASHHGALGTSRPGHYTVMYDDSGMTKDLCYKMCYELCFLSSRCRKPVSLPAPVHYAHLSCEKAKEVYKAMKNNRAEPAIGRNSIEQTLRTNPNYPGMSFV